MEISEIFQKPEFACIDEEKKRLILELAEKTKGKSAPETIEVFSQYRSQLTQGKTLTDTDREAIMLVLTNSMTGGERAQFQKMMAMFSQIQGRR